MGPYRILAASYTNDVYTLIFDPEKSSLEVESTVSVGFHPSWITSYPGDPSLVFTGLEQEDGQVVAIKYDKDWKGSKVAQVSSKGHSPCHLYATKDEIWVANYMSGSISSYPISPQHPYFLTSEPSALIQLEGKGPNAERQESAHAHQVVLTESGELLIADLGSDKVLRYIKSPQGQWTPNGHISYPAGGGPRHFAFYDDHLYTVLELSSALAQHSYTGTPSLKECKPTLTRHSEGMLGSEIYIPKPNSVFSKPLIYVSNRNDPYPEGDTIAVFTPSPFELVAEVRTGLNHVRGIEFGGENNKWLIAGGANGGGVKVFERTGDGTSFKEIASNPNVKAATGFLWV